MMSSTSGDSSATAQTTPAASIESSSGSSSVSSGPRSPPRCKVVGDYILGEKLGEGSFSRVLKGIHRTNGTVFAMKSITKEELLKPEMKKSLHREISVMRCLKGHPHIVELVDVLQTPHNVYLVMEMAAGGDLFERIPRGVGLPEDTARRYFQQIMSAVHYCHTRLVAHRDIKPENIVITASDTVKVADFGLSNLQRINTRGEVSRSLMLYTVCGTSHYVAPEVIRADPTAGYNGFVADIWSCGVVLFHMLSGTLPFPAATPEQVLERICCTAPDPLDAAGQTVSTSARRLVSLLLTKQATRRPSILEVVTHPWFMEGSPPALRPPSKAFPTPSHPEPPVTDA